MVEPGGKVVVRGYCRGDVVNEGGDLAVMRGPSSMEPCTDANPLRWVQGDHRPSTTDQT